MKTSPHAQSSCQYCGRIPNHHRNDCPAKSSICGGCGIQGHWKKVCRKSRSIRLVNTPENEDSDYENELEMGWIFNVGGEERWNVDVEVNGHLTKFKIDTGAAVSVINDKEPWLRNVTLNPHGRRLRAAGGIELQYKGTFEATFEYHGRSINETVYVLCNQPCSLLSRYAAESLAIVARIDTLEISPFKKEFPQLFSGLGHLDNGNNNYRITLSPNAKPHCEYTARKVPHPLLPQVKEELDKMVQQGVISPVTVPTSWCCGMVVVPKANNKGIRMCVDLTQLNKAVQREIYPMFSVDESLAKLSGSKIFSRLDANSGFHQIGLHEDSKLLTTFITPYGRYCFNRLPMGICSASEVFQRTMSTILEGVEGVICHMDDILIHASNQDKHDQQVREVLTRLRNAGLTLSPGKCEFSKDSVKFLGHIIDSSGIRADPDKISAINHFPAPTNITELQRFLGMVNQLAKFVQNLSEITEPIRQLLKKDNMWVWGKSQQSSFERIKKLLTSAPVLAHYNPRQKIIISCDASSVGIGGCLWTTTDSGDRRPVCYISRSLTDTEKNYATIEKEALAATWACEKLSEYVLGIPFLLETDHLPLVPLLSSKDLSKMPPRILRFRLRLMRFSPDIKHVPGKLQITADAFSRAPVKEVMSVNDELDIKEMESSVKATVSSYPTTNQRLEEIKEQQNLDTITSQIRSFCTNGWPSEMPREEAFKAYWNHKQHFTIVDELLMFNERLVIPQNMRNHILNCLHAGHLGITKCTARAQEAVWWPSITSDIHNMISQCHTCAKHQPVPKEPLIPTPLPQRPWSHVGVDLMELNGKTYIVAVDYFSRWAELRLMDNKRSSNAIEKLKAIFACHGIPDTLITDNAQIFSSYEFNIFATDYDFVHITSSPKYPKSNGEVERAIKTLKELLKKNKDPFKAVLAYRTAPLQSNGLSPSQLLMGRQLRTTLPVPEKKLQYNPPHMATIREKEERNKQAQKVNYDKKHRAQNLSTLQRGDRVWIRDTNQYGSVVQQSKYPRSYIIKTDFGQIRRNRSALVSIQGPLQTQHSSYHSGRDPGVALQDNRRHRRYTHCSARVPDSPTTQFGQPQDPCCSKNSSP